MTADGIKWWPTYEVIKYGPETVREITKDLGHEPSGDELRMLEARYGLVPDEITRGEGNSLLTAGLARITSLITGAGGNAFNNTNGYAGVGDSTTATTVGMTALQAATNHYYRPMDASNPTSSNGVISANVTFGTTEANYAWQEWVWGVGNAAPSAGATQPAGVCLNRAVQSLGTKTNGSTWTLQATVTLT